MNGTELSPFVKALDLKPHFEGGWYREVWKSEIVIPQSVLGAEYSGARPSATLIYYLLHPGEESRWHRVKSDEIWLWHAGGPLRLRVGGKGEKPESEAEYILGSDVTAGQQFQVIVPALVWQMAEPLGNEPVLVSCVVSPGFHIDDFEMIGNK